MAAIPSLAARFPLAQRRYDRTIHSIARQQFRAIPGYEQNDLENDLLEVLWKACMTYNPDAGAKFDTYVRNLWRNHFADLMKASQRDKRRIDFASVSLDLEAVRLVAEGIASGNDPESELLARITVSEIFRSGGKEAKR